MNKKLLRDNSILSETEIDLNPELMKAETISEAIDRIKASKDIEEIKILIGKTETPYKEISIIFSKYGDIDNPNALIEIMKNWDDDSKNEKLKKIIDKLIEKLI